MNRMDSTLTTSRPAIPGIAPARSDIVGGLVSSAVAIPLAMAFGMFAFVTLGDDDTLKVEARADSEQPLLENG